MFTFRCVDTNCPDCGADLYAASALAVFNKAAHVEAGFVKQLLPGLDPAMLTMADALTCAVCCCCGAAIPITPIVCQD